MAGVIGYIYKTTNLINGKIYIGQHQRESLDKYYYGGGKILRRAIEKYGKQCFKVEVIYWAFSIDRLNRAEIDFIKAFDSTNPNVGYNISTGGESGHVGAKMSEEAKRKIGLASRGRKHNLGRTPWNKGLPMPDEQRRKISERKKGKPFPALGLQRAIEANRGRKFSEERRRKLSLASMGKPGTRNGAKHTPETLRKISESNKGKHSVPMPKSAKEKLRKYWAGRPWNEARRAAFERSKLRLCS